jgi:hypothetical protein
MSERQRRWVGKIAPTPRVLSNREPLIYLLFVIPANAGIQLKKHHCCFINAPLLFELALKPLSREGRGGLLSWRICHAGEIMYVRQFSTGYLV